ncbi:hypothetical protein M3J09_012287 [Ascochyta lentis]
MELILVVSMSGSEWAMEPVSDTTAQLASMDLIHFVTRANECKIPSEFMAC